MGAQGKVRLILFAALLAMVMVLGVQPVIGVAPGSVLVVRVSSDISRPTVELVSRSLAEANAGGARLIVYELNTPGGDVGSVTEIMNDFNSSPIPVVVWVTPSGATAWSGGTYILMASHVAVMASGTTIGSAQPDTSTGQVLNDSKFINALSGLMSNNARLHNRNQTVAQEFITKNINLGPEEALRYHVIEFAADTLQSLLSQLEPYTLILSTTGAGTSVWKLVPSNSIGSYTYTQNYNFAGISQASSYTYNPGISITVLQVLSNPLIATVLFLVGLYAVVIGFKTPGYGLEIAGGVMVFLALLGYGIIGINAASILLFVLGIALTLIEIKTHVGIFALAGIGLIIFGSFLAFPLPGWELLSANAVASARQTLIAVALVMSGMFGLVVYKVAQARRLKVKVGPEQFTGKTGKAVSALSPRGEVRIEGQTWKAESVTGSVKEGELVEVVGREGLILRVKPQQTGT